MNDPQGPSSQSVCITVNLVVKDKYLVLLEITSHVDTVYGAANTKSSYVDQLCCIYLLDCLLRSIAAEQSKQTKDRCSALTSSLSTIAV